MVETKPIQNPFFTICVFLNHPCYYLHKFGFFKNKKSDKIRDASEMEEQQERVKRNLSLWHEYESCVRRDSEEPQIVAEFQEHFLSGWVTLK